MFNLYYFNFKDNEKFRENVFNFQDIDDNPPVITADITNITIDENGYSNDFQSIFINDKDFDYAYNTYSIRIE